MKIGLDRRINVLERKIDHALSPASRTWLSMCVAGQDHAAVAESAATPARFSFAGLSPEAIGWLTNRAPLPA